MHRCSSNSHILLSSIASDTVDHIFAPPMLHGTSGFYLLQAYFCIAPGRQALCCKHSGRGRRLFFLHFSLSLTGG